MADWPLRARLNLVIAVLALPLAALLAAAVGRGAAERETAAAERQLAAARVAAAGTARFIERTGELLAALAARPGAAAMGRDGCDPEFATFLAQHRDYANLLLVDADGRLRCSAQPLALDRPARLGPRYLLDLAREARGLVIGRPEFGFVSGRWVAPVVLPLRDAGDGFLGFIGVSIDLARLRPSGAPGLLLADGEGLVLAAGEDADPPPGAHLESAILAALEAAAGRDWSLVEHAGAPPRLVARAPVTGTGWFVLASADAAPLRATAWRDGFLAAALFLAVLLLGLRLARRLEAAVAVPLGRLGESFAALARGRPPPRLAPGGPAEVAAAGEAFGRLRDALGAQRADAGRREDELRALLAAGGEVAYVLSADGAALHYLGPGAEELYGDDVRRFAADPGLRHARVIEADRPRLAALRRQIAQSGRGEAEYRIRRGDGAERWLRERCRLLRDAAGAPWRQAGLLSDVTLARELVAGLKASEDRFRSLVELSSDWYWEQDAEFRFTTVTGGPAGAADVWSNARMLGTRRWDRAVLGLDETQWAAHRAALLRHESFRGLEYGVVLPDRDETVWIGVSGEPVFDADGNFTGYRGVGSDITARKRMERTLQESEARLALALEATSEGVWDYDIAADTIYFSPRFAALLGYADGPDLKRNFVFSQALHPEDRARALAAQERTLMEGAHFEETYRLRCREGAYRWFHGRGIAVRGDDGRPARFVGAIADVTAQREAEAQLRKLSTAVEQSPVSILITDTRGDIEFVNPRFCQASGYSFEEVRGRNPRLLKSGETPAEVYKGLWEAITAGRVWSGELHNRRKSGELIWEFVTIYPLLSESGEIVNFMGLKEDITLRKELTAREQLRQEQMLHHARLAAMGEMAAALAHELNQPLAAIANFSGVVEHQLTASRPDLAQVREAARAINGQALRAGDIVWRVREFSRRQESRREPADINGLVRDVVRLADIAAKSREVAYEYDLAPGLPQVPLDRVQIEQVLLNLIRNGVEAMEEVRGERRLKLSSRLAEGGAAVQVSVCDHGCGLPDRIAMDLFTPFFTTKPEGMGMGLSISRGIVESHGGRLWAAPNADGGTTFHLTLPLRKEDDR